MGEEESVDVQLEQRLGKVSGQTLLEGIIEEEPEVVDVLDAEVREEPEQEPEVQHEHLLVENVVCGAQVEMEESVQQVDPAKLRRDEVIQYKRLGEQDYIKGKIFGRAGKAAGPLNKWWNILDMTTGHARSEDLGKVEHLEKVAVEEEQEESV